jgi:hypothetical protein
MSTLAHQQQALLEALFAWPPQEAARQLQVHATGVGTQPQRGLQVYQANGHMLAERALQATYPVLAQLLGQASFADLARAFWHVHPPRHGDVAQWGEALAEFVSNSVQLQDVPYLPDVVRAEWALHGCATAANREATLGTLALLTTHDPQALTLRLAPGLATLCSAWPLASLLLAHRDGYPALASVAQQMQDRVAQDVVVWRDGLQPRLRQALPGEAALLRGLLAGMALEPALEAASGLDFSLWLPLAVPTGLVLGVDLLLSPALDTP